MAAAAFTALIFSVSCSKDDSGDQTPSTPENTDIAGNYSGTLSVSVSGGTPTPQAQNITVSWSENSTEAIDLSVADFAFGNIELGSIDLNSIPVTVDGDTYTFATDGAQSVTVGEGESSMTCTIEAHGTVTQVFRRKTPRREPGSCSGPPLPDVFFCYSEFIPYFWA